MASQSNCRLVYLLNYEGTLMIFISRCPAEEKSTKICGLKLQLVIFIISFVLALLVFTFLLKHTNISKKNAQAPVFAA